VNKLLGVIAVAIIFLIAPQTSAAQEPCGYFYACGGGEHEISGPMRSNANPHSYCSTCSYGVCHPVCDDFLVSNPDKRKRFDAVVAAANAGNVAAILRIAPALPEYVVYNADRKAIQIRSCAADVLIANIPVRNPSDRKLASALPRPSAVFATSVLKSVGPSSSRGLLASHQE
jgi:hypothetical protein